MNRIYKKSDAIRKRVVFLIVIVGFCLFFSTGIARAEVVEDENGFYLGLKLTGASLHTDEASAVFHVKDDGAGMQFDIGYRFNSVFTLEFVIGNSNHETSDSAIDANMETIQLFGCYRFSPEASFRPYLKGGFAGYALVLESGPLSARISGGGIAFGGGFRYFLSTHFSFGFDFTHNMIKYDKEKLSLGQFSYESEIEEHGRSTTLGLIFGYSF